MLYQVNGDLLTGEATVIMHQANCFSRMKSGIAAQISRLFPAAPKVDIDSEMTPDEKLGRYTHAWSADRDRIIVNLYGQYRWGTEKQQTDYEALTTAIHRFLKRLRKNEKKLAEKGFEIKIGVPYNMGCGLGGGDWNTVLTILQEASDEFNFDIYIYKL